LTSASPGSGAFSCPADLARTVFEFLFSLCSSLITDFLRKQHIHDVIEGREAAFTTSGRAPEAYAYESFATGCHRTLRSKGCLSNKTALAVIYKLAGAAEKSLHRLDGPVAENHPRCEVH
jgi:hypothetical protein